MADRGSHLSFAIHFPEAELNAARDEMALFTGGIKSALSFQCLLVYLLKAQIKGVVVD